MCFMCFSNNVIFTGTYVAYAKLQLEYVNLITIRTYHKCVAYIQKYKQKE